MPYFTILSYACLIFRDNPALFQRMIHNLQIWEKGIDPISEPYSGWDYFLPELDYPTKAPKAGRH